LGGNGAQKPRNVTHFRRGALSRETEKGILDSGGSEERRGPGSSCVTPSSGRGIIHLLRRSALGNGYKWKKSRGRKVKVREDIGSVKSDDVTVLRLKFVLGRGQYTPYALNTRGGGEGDRVVGCDSPRTSIRGNSNQPTSGSSDK